MRDLFGLNEVELDDAMADFGGIRFVAAGVDFCLDLFEFFGGEPGGGLGKRG